ncbi:MAG TPA: RT0821/Lpp0805 family surface protein [Candidatus Cybelea sp.]|nr:RT0821/Lpp0805 family surface protein [Candidatus Cybelea sp.]
MRKITQSMSLLAAAMMAAGVLAASARADGLNIDKQDIGTVLGGVGGALIGSQVGHGRGQLVGVAAGTLIGAYLGNRVGKSLDEADRGYMNNTNAHALETSQTGTTSAWRNPDSGNAGTITPERTYQTAGGQYCREFQQTITVEGKTQKGYGTACRQPDGSWKIVD